MCTYFEAKKVSIQRVEQHPCDWVIKRPSVSTGAMPTAQTHPNLRETVCGDSLDTKPMDIANIFYKEELFLFQRYYRYS